MVGDAVALGDDVLAGADGDAVHARDERGAGLLGRTRTGVVADRGGDEREVLSSLGTARTSATEESASTAMARRFFLARARRARLTSESEEASEGAARRGDPVAGGRRGLGLVARRERKRSDGRLGVGVPERDATVDEAR